jgi:hypothetical protein
LTTASFVSALKDRDFFGISSPPGTVTYYRVSLLGCTPNRGHRNAGSPRRLINLVTQNTA